MLPASPPPLRAPPQPKDRPVYATCSQVRVAKVELAAVREGLRMQLVHAMRWGHTLLIRLANTAADFEHSYCDPDTFPLQLFDASQSPAGTDAAASPVWSRVLRGADTVRTRPRREPNRRTQPNPTKPNRTQPNPIEADTP